MWLLDGTWGMHDGMGWWMVLGGFWMLLFWGAIVWAVIWGVSKATSRDGSKDDPLEIARTRYARGEITRDQFEQLRKDLIA